MPLALLILLSCAQAPWIEVGLGLTAWEPASDGDPAPLVYGAQGGWHLDVAARFGGFRLTEHALTWQAYDAASGAPVAFATNARITERSVQAEEDGWLRLGDRVVFDVGAPAEVADREVDVTATFGLDGSNVEDRLRVRVVDLGAPN